MPRAIVLGAGVSGLTTAVCLAERGCAVTVWTSLAPRQTTSVVAGAMWGPSFAEPADRVPRWCEVSLRAFQALARDPASGVRMLPCITAGGGGEGPLPPQVRLIPDLRPCPPDEMPPGYAGGFRSTMPVIDMGPYLDYLSARLTANGGTIETRTVGSLAEAVDAAPVVVNCSGLGARDLAGDLSLRPVRGQHVVFENPGITELFMELARPEWTSVLPHPARVVCGGIAVPDSWDTTVDDAVTERIVARCRRVAPALREARIIDVVVGLRPDRPSIRVQGERVGTARVVHNYGHGGEGVSLSWGCARDAAELALVN